MDDDVDAAVAYTQVPGQPALRRVLGEVQLQRAATDPPGDGPELLALRRYVETHHVRAVPRQGLGDDRADAPGSPGDQGGPAVQRPFLGLRGP
ncbi:hypothetical protein [Streptomyces caelestis]|uniref:Uncharacterized protein n=1 Tax=Streptomyces caelestis TaxID=36816 RepID=A0A7W9LWP1_9ACTN|nr:hypothetical protein [Streptomyces caelestis]